MLVSSIGYLRTNNGGNKQKVMPVSGTQTVSLSQGFGLLHANQKGNIFSKLLSIFGFNKNNSVNFIA